MRRVDELGISETPWRKLPKTKWIADSDKNYVAGVVKQYGLKTQNANAKIIAAAPELYEALREAILEHCGVVCEEWKRRDGGYCDMCYVNRWKKVVKKAGGGE